jgi:hypothetical protein
MSEEDSIRMRLRQDALGIPIKAGGAGIPPEYWWLHFANGGLAGFMEVLECQSEPQIQAVCYNRVPCGDDEVKVSVDATPDLSGVLITVSSYKRWGSPKWKEFNSLVDAANEKLEQMFSLDATCSLRTTMMFHDNSLKKANIEKLLDHILLRHSQCDKLLSMVDSGMSVDEAFAKFSGDGDE